MKRTNPFRITARGFKDFMRLAAGTDFGASQAKLGGALQPGVRFDWGDARLDVAQRLIPVAFEPLPEQHILIRATTPGPRAFHRRKIFKQ